MSDAKRKRAEEVLIEHCLGVNEDSIDAMIAYGQEREQAAFAVAAKVCRDRAYEYRKLQARNSDGHIPEGKLSAEADRCANAIEEKYGNETSESVREDILDGRPQDCGSTPHVSTNIEVLSASNFALRAALVDVLGWVPGREAWHTDEPVKAAERARAVLAKYTPLGALA